LERRTKFQKRQASERAIAEALADGASSASGGAFGKDTAAVIKAMEAVEPLPKNEWTKFYDYDLSKMKDTRAGFIKEIEESSSPKSGTTADDEDGRKRKWQPTIVQQDPCTSFFLGGDDLC